MCGVGSIGIFIGRLQVITIKHLEMFQRMIDENTKSIIFIVKGKKTSLDKENNPLDIETQLQMLGNLNLKNTEIRVIKTAYFIDELEDTNLKYNLYCGSDRNYNHFKKYLKNLNIITLERDNEISASNVRNYIKNNDYQNFKRYTPSNIHSMYNKLKKEMRC